MRERPTRYRTRDLLSPRQREVLALVAKGRTNAEIARELGIGFESVKSHVSEILLKLNVDSREEAAVIWRESQGVGGLVPRMVESLGLLASSKGAALGVAGIALVVALSVAVVLSQSGSESPPATAPDESPSPIATATPPPGPYPIGTRTGDSLIDQVLAAVESRDADALFNLIHYAGVPCAGTDRLNPPGIFTCPNGEPHNTLIPSVQGDGTEGAVYPEGSPIIPGLVANLLDNPYYPLDPRVLAVALMHPDYGPNVYGVFFESGHFLTVDATGITGFHRGGLSDTFDNGGRPFLLPPASPPTGGRANVVIEALLGAANSDWRTDDRETLFGVFDAWRTLAPTKTADLGGGPAAVSTISVAIVRGVPDDEGVNRTQSDLVSFAVVDGSGKCAMAFITVGEAGSSGRRSSNFGYIPDDGIECSGKHALELLGLP